MQAVNAIAAGITKQLTPRGRHDNNVNKLSRLLRRNFCKFKTPYSNVNLVAEHPYFRKLEELVDNRGFKYQNPDQIHFS